MAAKGFRLVVVLGALAACAERQQSPPPAHGDATQHAEQQGVAGRARDAAAAEPAPADLASRGALSCDDPAIAPQGCVGVERVRRLPATKDSEPPAVARAASDPEPHYRLAQVFERQGLVENALEEYRQAAELSAGRHSKAFFAAARLSEQLGRRVDAVQLCRRFLERNASSELPEERAWCTQLLADARDH